MLIEFATPPISMGEKCVLHVMNALSCTRSTAWSVPAASPGDPSNAIGIANLNIDQAAMKLHQRAREYIYMHFGR